MATDSLQFFTVGPWANLNLGFTTLPTYYVIISLIYCVCILWFYKRCERRNLPQRNAMDISLIILVAGFVGARAAHVVFEQLPYYTQNPLEIFYFWQGGFVFYGGALLAYFSAFLYARRLNITFWLWHDTLAPVLALGYAVGRLACFFAGCCYGEVTEVVWATPLDQVNVATGVLTTVLRHPTQLYASAFEFANLFFLLWYERRHPKLGQVFLAWVIFHCAGRFVMEMFRADLRGPSVSGLSISALISLILIAVALTTWSKRR